MRTLLEVGLIVSALFVLWGTMFSGKPMFTSEADGFTKGILILWALCTVVLLVMDTRPVKTLSGRYRAWVKFARVWGLFVAGVMIFMPEETDFIRVIVVLWSLFTVVLMIVDRRRVKRLNDAYRSRVS